MQAIVVVHGILGSKLNLDSEEIWPPSLGEIINNHYRRIAKLMDRNAIATDIVYQYTSFYQIYGPLIEDVDAIIAEQGGIRPNFWYDWRIDLALSADHLAQTIAAVCSGPNPATSVSIVAHSMGGLVSRLVLESGKYNSASWFRNITRFIAICVPHVGAPIAVARALGLEGSTTITAGDMKTIMNNADFPAGFDLFPALAYRNSVLYDRQSGPQDIYAGPVATKYGLSTNNQSAAQTSWSNLNFANRPKGVQYISIAGTGHPTENTYEFDNTVYRSTTSVDGDGTVPHWSAAFGNVDKLYTVPGDHIGIMNSNPFRQTLSDIFGSTTMMVVKPELAVKPGVSISLNKHSFQAGESMNVLLIPDHKTTEINGKLQIRKASVAADQLSAQLTSVGVDTSVSYAGPPASSLPLTISAPEADGAYVLSFEGTHRSSTRTSATFFVRRNR